MECPKAIHSFEDEEANPGPEIGNKVANESEPTPRK
jgi:hypothetical protein